MSSSSRPLVVGVVGYHKVGKTTIVARMVSIWRQMGLRVGVLKHDGHADAENVDDWEKPGSDTERVREAGASLTMVVGGGQTLLRTTPDLEASDVHALLRRMEAHALRMGRAVDVIVVEGYKASDLPKVAIITPDAPDWHVADDLTNVVALVQSPLFTWQGESGFTEDPGFTGEPGSAESPRTAETRDYRQDNPTIGKKSDEKQVISATRKVKQDEVVPSAPLASFTQKHLTVYHESNLQDLCESLWLRHSR